MNILAELWPEWVSKQTIMSAGYKVGISSRGLSVEWMQEDKFLRTELCVNDNTEKNQWSTAVTISSPKDVRYGSARYRKHKCESAMEAYQTVSNKSISLEEIPNLLPVTKVTPKMNNQNVRVTQVHGSMEGGKILETVSSIQDDKTKKEQDNKKRKSKQQHQIEAFYKYKKECTCGKNVCAAIKLRQCSCCHNVLKSTCSKASCRGKTGSKPLMIKPFCEIGPKKCLQFESDENNVEDFFPITDFI